ncbi:cupin domain-containing protein [Streptosporangium lutulentum]|uniref:Gentisate 1,2-dioxygenase n=1 Tax=Streptosporangium lutulentum TaxID=1461250 RepID=A0ABT9QGC8_9ACTN|nr:cupin domain-containing protein [Streptosporangium lutulentum]MDP9845816.1 gentisate 1,2-dioxygenase [Streptosporangium lutulentum]
MTITQHGHEQKKLNKLYAEFDTMGLIPLWTIRDNLMPMSPRPQALPHLWRWADVLPLAERSGKLVPAGRGCTRRAIALSNPGLPGLPYATPTLWAAVHYLAPRETAPAHRHSQTAFRFVVEGESVWTNVDGDAVAMRRGDLLLAPSWTYHEHHNATDRPMIWLDGLDIPLVNGLDADFFEFGLDTLSTCETPERSRGERLWGHPGLRPIGQADRPSSPLTAYRWEHTDAALRAQLEMETEDVPSAVIEPGHAGVRFSNPTTGKDSLVTIRTEMHRLREGTRTAPVKTVGSAVWQVFEGTGVATVGDRRFEISKGDLFVVPSWYELVLEAGGDIDLFRFSDEPVYEALGLADTYRGGA